MTQPVFRRFLGIDWSGAEGEYHSSIQVAQFSCDTKRLQSVTPPNSPQWSRQSVLEYIRSQADQRTLIGLDFGFSLPWHGSNCLPACFERLQNARELWAYVENFCEKAPFFHGGPIWLSEESPFRPFLKCWSRKFQHEGLLFNGGLLRKAEKAAKAEGFQPKSIYRMAGPQVGMGSFAGMRILHALGRVSKENIAIWPFDETERAKVVVVEVYPAVFYRRAGQTRPTNTQVKNGTHLEIVRKAVQFFEIESEADIPHSIDAMDAFVSAAALFSLSKKPAAFHVSDDTTISAKEGWIFGLPSFRSGS